MPLLFITGHGVLGAGRTTSVSFDCTQLNSLGTQNLVIFALPSRPSCFASDVVVYKCIVSDLKMRIKSSEKSEKMSGAEEWQELHTTPIGILELVRKLDQVNSAISTSIFLKNLLGNRVVIHRILQIYKFLFRTDIFLQIVTIFANYGSGQFFG